MTFYYSNVDLVNANVYTKFSQILSFILMIWNKNQILTPIKGRNTVSNLGKMTLYNPNIDVVSNIGYTKLLNLSIRSQDMEQKPNSDTYHRP